MNQSYIVCIGASAGGLAALFEFFDHTLPNGISYVITMHLHPHQKSRLAELIQKHTTIPVREVENNTLVFANHIYVMPHNQVMSIENGCLMLRARDLTVKVNQAINLFFCSLAKDGNFQKIAIILSGTGDDGTLGLVDCHKAGLTLLRRIQPLRCTAACP